MTELPASFYERPFAHRGLHDRAKGRPENSRAACEAAIEAGYAIEIDLQFSADDVAMVFHDYDLKRLTIETGPVRGRTSAELGAIPLFGNDETIPTLADILGLVKGRVPLLIEFKDQDGAMGPDVGKMEAAAAPLLNEYVGPLALMSFNPHTVVALGRLCPDIPRGLTTCAFTVEDWPHVPAATRERLADIPDYAHAGCSFVSHDRDDLENRALEDVRLADGRIFTWTIKSAEQEKAAREHADQITFERYLPK